MRRSFVCGLLLLALPAAAFASAVIESLEGEVQWGGGPVFQGQRVGPQGTFTTGPASQILLRFDDGMQIAVNENTSLRIVDFRAGSNGRAVFDLMSGAARVVTGAVARDNPKQFFFRTPHTQLGVEQPSDFTVVLVNPAYVSVARGSVVSSNGAGTVSLKAGSTSHIASAAAAPANVSAASMPQVASTAMTNLNVASLTAPAGGPAAGAPVGGAAYGAADFALPALAIGGAAAGAAALLGSDDGATATTHH
jgi:hypothetical protein